MNYPYQPERRSVRYHLHLPVSVKLANEEILARSENISFSGILLISTSLIPVGCTVELTVGAVQIPNHGLPLAARGKVLRVKQQASGNFTVAIECERPFEFMRRRP